MRRFTRQPRETLVRLCGAADIGSLDSAELSLLAAAEQKGGGVTVDLSDLTFIDCRVVALLARAQSRAAAEHRPFAVVGATGTVSRVVELVAPNLLAASPRLALAS
jgi:anti-anti-sigma factor